MNTFKNIRIADIIPETKDTKTFVLECDEPIQYKAGQFLSFIFKKRHGEERRSYSFSSAPGLAEPLAITVKRVANGEFSRLFTDKVRVGEHFRVIGPSGFFTIPEDFGNTKQIFFLAAGSGITPVFSLIKWLLHFKPHLKLVLLYSNHAEKEIIFRNALNKLVAEYPDQFRMEYLLSISPKLERARMSKWLLSVLLQEYREVALHEMLFYLCGPFDYMRMVTIQLLNEGLLPSQIRKENFSIFKPVIRAIPPDMEKRRVEIHIDGRVYHIETQYPDSILAAAKKKGITLPYSCEAGRCGTCVARCLEGTVWMSYNEVLMDDEIEKGRVLTCVGYPVGGDVKLEF